MEKHHQSANVLDCVKSDNGEFISGNVDNDDDKISQNADDSTLLLSDVNSIYYVMSNIKTFCKVPGVKLNIDNTGR